MTSGHIVFVLGSYPAVFRVYSCLYAQGSLLVDSGKHMWCWGIYPGEQYRMQAPSSLYNLFSLIMGHSLSLINIHLVTQSNRFISIFIFFLFVLTNSTLSPSWAFTGRLEHPKWNPLFITHLSNTSFVWLFNFLENTGFVLLHSSDIGSLLSIFKNLKLFNNIHDLSSFSPSLP